MSRLGNPDFNGTRVALIFKELVVPRRKTRLEVSLFRYKEQELIQESEFVYSGEV